LNIVQGIEWYDSVSTESTGTAAYSDERRLSMLFVPNHVSPAGPEVRQRVRDNVGPFDLAFLHHGFQGARLSNGFTLPEGHDHRKVKGIAHRIFSGDIHEAQTLGKVVYVGTPYPIDFDEQHPCRIIEITPQRKVISHPITIIRKHVFEVSRLLSLDSELRRNATSGDHVKILWRMSRADLSRSSELFKRIGDLCTVHRVQLAGVQFQMPASLTARVESIDVKAEDIISGEWALTALDKYIKIKGIKPKLAKTGRFIAKNL
jgi:hypothetical protein